MSRTSVMTEIRDIVAQVTGINAVYNAAETGPQGMPEALNEFPCILIDIGEGEITRSPGGGVREDRYGVELKFFDAMGGAANEASTRAIGLMDTILDKLDQNVTLGGDVQHWIAGTHTRSQLMTYSGIGYYGFVLFTEIVEQKSVTFAGGT